MSSKKENPASATNGGTTKYESRLCHVVKRPDFDGYGFNLHAEKGRPGQYIGKVDDGSPAEAAGLRQGDRILEVNGTNITHETHKKVVELIKGVPNETKLLVIDPRADPTDLKAAMTAGKDVNDSSKQQQQQANGKGTTADEKSKGDVSSNSSEETNNKKNASKNSSSNGSANNNDDTSANKMMMTNGDSTKDVKQQQQQKPVVDQIIEDTKAMTMSATSVKSESNGKPVTTTTANGSSKGATPPPATTKEAPKLNLNMTAAELRAQLAARKKYDPKNDVCDLRKKYEIIQKM